MTFPLVGTITITTMALLVLFYVLGARYPGAAKTVGVA